MGFTDELHESYDAHWQSMLDEPFLREVAEGTIDDARFAEWLRQDYVFVREAIPNQALKIARGPEAHRSMFTGAVAALERELRLFESMAEEHGVSLEAIEPAPTNLAYINFIRVTNVLEPYEHGFTVTYAAERAYLDSWLRVKSMQRAPSKWQRFIENWTTDGFRGWVAELSRILDVMAEAASSELRGSMERKFFETIRYERRFWQMAFHGERW